jgi:hypothetical protein
MIPSTPKDKLKVWHKVAPTALSFRDPGGTWRDLNPASTITFAGASYRGAKYTFPKVQRVCLTVKYTGGAYPYPMYVSGLLTDSDVRDRTSPMVLDMAAPAAGVFGIGSGAPGTVHATISNVYGEVLA